MRVVNDRKFSSLQESQTRLVVAEISNCDRFRVASRSSPSTERSRLSVLVLSSFRDHSKAPAPSAGSIAALEIITKIGRYYLHERVWNAIPWGLRS